MKTENSMAEPCLTIQADPCRLCPRDCRIKRNEGGRGRCNEGATPRIARAALHMWEEPCISGARGSGAVFFTGCSLGCVYCQNRAISRGGEGAPGREVTPDVLRRIFLRLIEEGAHNINLVTPLHFTDGILPALNEPLPVPVVVNTGGYERVDTLRRWEGKAQIWLPDVKYALTEPARRYSAAPDYPQVAKAAIQEMFRQVGPYELDDDGMLKKGVVIRHLVLPGQGENTRRVLEWIAETFRPGDVLVSLMSQYTPPEEVPDLPDELRRPIKPIEYKLALRHMERLGLSHGYCQEATAATEEYLPAFDLSGVD